MHRLWFQSFRGLAGLAEIRPEWDALLAQSPDARFYHDPRWHEALQRHVLGSEVHYLLRRRGRETVALVPLEGVQRRSGPVTLRALRLPEHPVSDLADVLVAPGQRRRGLFGALLRYLRQGFPGTWDCLELDRFTERSVLKGELGAVDRPCMERGRSAYLSLDALPPDTGAALSGKQLRNVRRLRTRAERDHGEVRFTSLGADRRDTQYASFLEVEQAGWKGRGGTAIALRSDARAFYAALLDTFDTTGQAVLDLLQFGDRAVAGQLGLRNADGTLSLLKIGYDEDYADYGPGAMLLQERFTREAGVSTEVSLTTSPPWAARWHLRSEPTFQAALYNTTVRGRLLHASRELRRTLPAAAAMAS